MTLNGKFPVLLTFDVDGEALWLNRDPANANRPVVLSQGRYGPVTGVPKILKLLADHKISATFFVPGWIAEHYPDTVRMIVDGGHEIGHHGYLHEWLDRVPPEDEESILIRGIEIIERAAGARPVGYRAPAWVLTPRSIELLDRYGFKYSSNMMDADGPYRHRIGSDLPTGIIEFPVDWALDDTSLYLYALQIPGAKLTPNTQVLDLWCGSFDGLYETGASCVLTCHPQLTGRPYRLQALDAFIRHVLERDEVSFVRADTAAEHFDRILS